MRQPAYRSRDPLPLGFFHWLGMVSCDKSGRDLELERRRNRLALAHPLKAFELIRCPIELATQVGFVAEEAVRDLPTRK